MKNIITATIAFCFKGETHTPSITIELDEHIATIADIPNLYPLIATANNVDHYSYEYEMMQAETIKYSHAQGLVAAFIVDGVLDTENFVSAWQEKNITRELLEIAQRHMDLSGRDQQPELERALMDAYLLGIKTKKKV